MALLMQIGQAQWILESLQYVFTWIKYNKLKEQKLTKQHSARSLRLRLLRKKLGFHNLIVELYFVIIEITYVW